MLRLVLGLACCLLPLSAAAQFTDDFSDGDFTADPAWTGTTDRWTVGDLDGDLALQTNGEAASDTLFLATPSVVSRGTWTFTFAHRTVNLSNFNGARVFLTADQEDLTGAVRGYFLQLGTNNSDEVRLYRQDGDPSVASNRVLLGASAEQLLDGDDNTLTLTVTRSEALAWTVAVNGTAVISAEDDTYTTSTHVGLWVKHTAASAQSYFFDDFVVEGDSGPEDTTPPALTDIVYTLDLPGFSLDFSEPIRRESVQTTDFTISDVGNPADAFTNPRHDPASPRVILDLGQNNFLTNGDYDITISGIADEAGNVIRDTTVTVTVSMEPDTTPPALENVEASSATSVAVRFDEEVNGCRVEVYEISGGIGMPEAVSCPVIPEDPTPEFTAFYELQLAQPLVSGATYTLTVRDVADLAGNVLEEASMSFLYFEDDGVRPQPGEIVVNEIMYDPPETGLEYVELLNLTNRAFNLADLTFSDDRRQPVALTDRAALIEPGGYVVLVQDGAVFSATFPGVPFVEPASWPALNNSGDAVILYEGDTELDAVFFESAWGGDGVALERRDPTGPADAAVNWGISEAPGGGTPGQQNSLFEIDDQPPQPQSVTPSSDGAMLTVVFDEPLDPSSVRPDAFSLDGAVHAITSAALEDDGLTVTLGVAPALNLGAYTLTIRDIRDLKGNTLGSATLAFPVLRGAVPQPGDLVINEIMYDPAEDAPEYVEVLNRSEEIFDLRDFTLADDRSQPVTLTEDLVSLEAGAYAVLVQDSMAFAQAFPGVPFVEVTGWPALNNSGDAVVLAYAGTAIDSVAYTSSWGGEEVSLERIDPAGPSNSRFNWGASVDARAGTPGQQNSVFAPDLTPPTPLFAEQVQDDEVEVFFDEPLDPASVGPDAFMLDDGRTPRFTLLQDENTSVLLPFDGAISGAQLTLDGLRDLRGNSLGQTQITIAYRPRPGDLRFNEIMFDPLADDTDGRPDQPEYVELWNASGRTLSLRHLYWTDVPNEDGEADTLRLGDTFRSVPPEGFAVVFANTDPPDGSTTLAAAFPAIDFGAPSIALLPQRRASLSLTNSGDLIRLHRSDDAVLDEVFYDPGWHNPNLRDATGTALERISTTAPTDDATNWTSSVSDAGGTPGQPNSVALARPGEPQAETGITIAPSPFSPDNDGFDDQTRIRYTLDAPALVRARIFDARGRLVRTLEDARLAGRTGELIWDGLDDDRHALRVGIYVVYFEALDTDGGTARAFKETVVLARRF